MSNSLPQPPILWKQVLSLTVVQGAIALMWVVYGVYLPQLLAQFGMSLEAAIALVAIESGLAIIIEPIMGSLSDRSLRWVGSRFPVIVVGVVAASALFIAIPLLAMLGAEQVNRLVVVSVLVTWSVAMAIFHSPVLSLLRRYSSVPQLPIANSLLILTSGLIGTARPAVNQAILSFGPLLTFTTGSVVLLLAAVILRKVDPPSAPTPPTASGELPPLVLPTLMLAGGLGLCIGWGIRLVMDTFVKVFQNRLPDTDVGLVMFWVAVGLAVLAVPAGLVASQLGNRRIVFVSLILTMIFLQLMVFSSTRATLAVCVVILVISLSLVTNGIFPLVLSLVPPTRAGLGTGMYLGGGAAATCIFGVFFSQLQQLNIGMATLLAAIAFFIAAVCVFSSGKSPTPVKLERP